MKELVELAGELKKLAWAEKYSCDAQAVWDLGDKLKDFIPILTERHRAEVLAAEAAALRLAAAFVEKNTPYEQGIGSVGIPMAKHIRENLIPDTQSALDAHDAEVRRVAKLEEAEWWIKGHICENSKLCEGCLRLGTARSTSQPGGEEK